MTDHKTVTEDRFEDLRAAIAAYANSLARHGGEEAAVDVAWQLRQIMAWASGEPHEIHRWLDAVGLEEPETDGPDRRPHVRMATQPRTVHQPDQPEPHDEFDFDPVRAAGSRP